MRVVSENRGNVKKAKVDALIKRKVAEARAAGILEGQRMERDAQPRVRTMESGAVLIGIEPARLYVDVRLTPSPRLRIGDVIPPDFSVKVVRFRAVQRKWQSANGHLVYWFDWQHES